MDGLNKFGLALLMLLYGIMLLSIGTKTESFIADSDFDYVLLVLIMISCTSMIVYHKEDK